MKSFTLSFNSPLLRGHHTDKFVVPRRRKLFSCFSFFVSLAFFLSATATAIQINTIDIGVAKIDVTPTTPVVLAGYGSRNTPYDSIDGQLWARALVIGRSKPVAVVVLDNCGVPKAISALVKKQLRDTGLTDDRILVAATHTHNAPTLVGYAPILWQGRMTPEQELATENYTRQVVSQMVTAVKKAMTSREPMTLEWGQGRVLFGGNRRVLNAEKWAGFGLQQNGPVDHSLPILAARDRDGVVRMIWANYACHCTTVGSRNTIGGDWAGYANDAIEKTFPDATSLTTIGFGADIGPQPSGTVELAKKHGAAISTEVERLLKTENDAQQSGQSAAKTRRINSEPTVVSRSIELPLNKPPGKKYWEQQLSTRGWSFQLATAMLKQIQEKGAVADQVDYPITLWKFGDQLAMAFLPGEVVVDYAVRLKSELDWQRLWLTAWTNDMPGYIPSRRVLLEGGYEAEFSQVYYGLPGTYHPAIENRIVNCVKDMAGQEFLNSAAQPESPFHKMPSLEPGAFRSLGQWLLTEEAKGQSNVINKIRELIQTAQPAVHSIPPDSGEKTNWNNFAGEMVPRVFIRQEQSNLSLSWTSLLAANLDRSSNRQQKGKNPASPKVSVLCFSGGLGWLSEPKTAGFEIQIGNNDKIQFDVVKNLSRWKSESGQSELIYLPMWKSDVDSGGFFFLIINNQVFQNRSSIKLMVRSLGTGSKRWFGLDRHQDIKKHLNQLEKVFAPK